MLAWLLLGAAIGFLCWNWTGAAVGVVVMFVFVALMNGAEVEDQ
jgi:hypothetical protein